MRFVFLQGTYKVPALEVVDAFKQVLSLVENEVRMFTNVVDTDFWIT